jgi:beta-lactamase superfamily II metal-dependent hydrolase
LTDSLTAVAGHAGTPKVELDLFKLAHHGSAGNITRELLALVACDRFVVSTNGDHFNHPDAEAIEVVGRPGAATPPTVYFNYLSDTTKAWSDSAAQQRVGIRAVFGDGGHLSIEV